MKLGEKSQLGAPYMCNMTSAFNYALMEKKEQTTRKTIFTRRSNLQDSFTRKAGRGREETDLHIKTQTKAHFFPSFTPYDIIIFLISTHDCNNNDTRSLLILEFKHRVRRIKNLTFS